MAANEDWNSPAPTPNCIRCGRPLTPEICGEEFIATGICSDCWTTEDDDETE